MNGTLHPTDTSASTTRYRRPPQRQPLIEQHSPQDYPDRRPLPRFVPGIGPVHRLNLALRPSSDDAVRHLASMHDTLIAVHTRTLPDHSSVALPSGLDRSVLETQPFQVRTWNCLNAAALFTGTHPLIVSDLLRLPQFGHASLRDLLLVVENYLKQCARPSVDDSFRDSLPNQPDTAILSSPARPPIPPQQAASPFAPCYQPLHQLLVAASEFHGATTLGDILAPSVAQLAASLGLLPKLNAARLDTIVDSRSRYSVILLNGLRDLCELITPTQRTVIDLRFVSYPPKSLAEVGIALDLSRERIRQIQAKLTKRIRLSVGAELDALSSVLRAQFGAIARELDVDSRLLELFPDDGTFGASFARQLLKSELGYTETVNGVCLDNNALRVVQQMRSAAHDVAEDSIIDQARLQASLPDDDWRQRWPLLLRCCSFFEFLGSLTVRDSARTRTKAALLWIGEPATREQLAELCGLTEERVGSYLSSFPTVVRADKARWGLAEWIDDEYEGIVSEIIQRIHEDGGITTTQRLFAELPHKFGVTTGSVRAFLQTPRFAMRDGHVSLADISSVQLRHLEDVIHGHDERDLPYWSFVVHERYLEGFSLNGVPPELAKHFGCAPDGAVQVCVTNPPGCRNISLQWRLSSHVGATMGYLAEPLRCLRAASGDRVRVTLASASTIELSIEDSVAPSDTDQLDPASLLRKMKHRRKVV